LHVIVPVPSLRELLHPDDLTGLLGRGLWRLARPVPNTLAHLDAYLGHSPASLFPKPARLPAVQVRPRWALRDLVSEDLIFPSLHEPIEPRFRQRYAREYGATHTVYARRLRHARTAARPRILYLHGYLQPETYLEELVLLAGMALTLDAEVIQVQPPYHGRRTPAGSRFSGEFFCTADLVRTLEALRQAVLDARTLLAWLLAEDPRPVGVLGLSLGGTLALTLACVEDRLAFAVALAAHMDLQALVADAPVLAPMRAALRAFGWSAADLGAFLAAIGWPALRPTLPPPRVRLFAAADDRFFAPAAVAALWRRWGRPPIRWYPCSHMGFIPRLPEVLAAVRAFLDEQRAPLAAPPALQCPA
jgi:pimeloyl-ACP methyl ester carboxylesterase